MLKPIFSLTHKKKKKIVKRRFQWFPGVIQEKVKNKWHNTHAKNFAGTNITGFSHYTFPFNTVSTGFMQKANQGHKSHSCILYTQKD